jgi:KamA family protein
MSEMLMTAVSVVTPQKRDWKVVMSESFQDADDLLEYCEIDNLQTRVKGSEQFAFRVTRYFASLIEKGNALDPLLLQVLPGSRELQIIDGYSKDAVGDRSAMPVKGLIHKYHGRVLLTLTGACAIHCRYCFRRHFPYSESSVDYKMDGQVMKYLAGNKEVSEVILSGGDPLMVSDYKLANLVVNLNRIPHIRTLRIHSRVLSVLPERVTEALIEILQRRMRERRRAIIAKNIQAARKEFQQGDCQPATPREIMKDILS